MTKPQTTAQPAPAAPKRDAHATDQHADWATHDLRFSGDAQRDLSREWLLTNATGAYAMGTALGVNTRRYHGLLIAAQHPPVGRIVALNQVLEQLTLGADTAGRTGESETLEFTAAMFHGPEGGDVYAPRGHTMLQQYERGLTVQWRYATGSVRFTRELNLHWKQQAATLRYVITGLNGPARLKLSPMLTLRDFHALLQKDQAGSIEIKAAEQRATIIRHQGDHPPAVTVACDRGRFIQQADWWYNQHYGIETDRGQDDTEDLFIPGGFLIDLEGADEEVITLTVALGDAPARPQRSAEPRRKHLAPAVAAMEHAVAAARSWLIDAGMDEQRLTHLPRMLAIAADDFVVDRRIAGKKLSTILAGYPWFADWGRDTFISLPGLLLSTGRHEEARSTLQTFAAAIRNGLVPNRFDDYSESVASAHYNTVDASLWFINAAMQYLDVTGDLDAWNDWLCDACNTIIDAYIKGTDYDIRMAGDGLITAGSLDTQLTWMDAACGGRVFTPRPGKAVEINALWYDALIGMAERLVERDPKTASHYEKLGKRISRAFVKVFWDAQDKYLRDHVWIDEAGVEHADRSLRPNQIFVAALPRSPLPRTKQQQVVTAVRKRLLTPFGLRTLPDDHAHYHPRYCGPQMQRDEAYHQGTIWPWLIGPYAEAVLRTGRFSDDARREAAHAVAPLLLALVGSGPFPGLGQLHEIHEAAEPHRPVGCMAQAWSVAEVIRILNLLGHKPT